MESINPNVVIAELRTVGAWLKQAFRELPPLVENTEMMAEFHIIDGHAETALKSALTTRYPNIAGYAYRMKADSLLAANAAVHKTLKSRLATIA